MDRDVFALAEQAEDTHWWFAGRRAILSASIAHAMRGRPGPRTVLEVGCGNGGNLSMLAGFGRVWAIELDREARARAVSRGIAQVESGSLPDDLAFAGRRFAVVAALDVIEHVDADLHAVRALATKVQPGGLMVLTVPAFQALWSPHDNAVHHKRRYTLGAMRTLVEAAGLDVVHATYFNFLLFPVAAGYILAQKLLQRDARSAMKVPARWANAFLRSIFAAEAWAAPWLRLPFGTSSLVVAELRPAR